MVAALCAMHERLDPARYAMLPDVVERYARWLPARAADPRSVFLVAARDGVGDGVGDGAADAVLSGFLVGTIEKSVPIYTLAEFGFIHDVWVEPAERGNGIGKVMVSEACRRFAERGAGQVRLETAALNEGARKLFVSCGFRVGTVDMLRELGTA
jgi:ribosomal protein S18 acetylase RimI-like enzyme